MFCSHVKVQLGLNNAVLTLVNLKKNKLILARFAKRNTF